MIPHYVYSVESLLPTVMHMKDVLLTYFGETNNSKVD
jgi:hypothetical protein